MSGCCVESQLCSARCQYLISLPVECFKDILGTSYLPLEVVLLPQRIEKKPLFAWFRYLAPNAIVDGKTGRQKTPQLY